MVCILFADAGSRYSTKCSIWGPTLGGNSQQGSTKAAELFGERWTALIPRDLGFGTSRFARLQRGVPLASPTVLSRRLRQLEAEGIVERRRSDTGRSWTYHLTPAGKEFVPIVTALGVWGARWASRELADHEVDASLLLWALGRFSRSDAFGNRRVTVKLTFTDQPSRKRHYWYLIEEGYSAVRNRSWF